MIRPKNSLIYQKPSEYQIQCQIAQYCHYRNIPCFAIPMGEMRASYRYGEYDKLQAIKTGAKIKKMGGKRGIADLILIYDKRTIYLEIKTEKGKQSKEQKEFQEICKKNNQPYFVVRNVDEVAKIVNKIGEGVDNKKLIN